MSPLKVLYVDDEPDIREVATLSLQLDPTIEVRAAESGPEALALIVRGDWAADVVLLDVMMPGMDGPGVLKALREMGVTTPVVFITARAQSHERGWLIDLGALGVMTKPFDPMSLAKDLRAVLSAADLAA
ncbi:MAG TPA: response regulator [Caulobacteraceae bacterium]|jgi:CheY-like chemotaxis protein|nr:response regulator [Caulobacteraceae bacterium]